MDSAADAVQAQLLALQLGDDSKVDEKARAELKKRKLVSEVSVSFSNLAHFRNSNFGFGGKFEY